MVSKYTLLKWSYVLIWEAKAGELNSDPLENSSKALLPGHRSWGRTHRTTRMAECPQIEWLVYISSIQTDYGWASPLQQFSLFLMGNKYGWTKQHSSSSRSLREDKMVGNTPGLPHSGGDERRGLQRFLSYCCSFLPALERSVWVKATCFCLPKSVFWGLLWGMIIILNLFVISSLLLIC